MGKQKRQRRKPHKEHPTGLPSVKDFIAEETEGLTNEDREKALQTVYEEVQSADVKEKLSGLATLESMSYDSTLAIQIAKNGIARMIGPLLVDQNVLVRSGSASALRYIAENGKNEAHACLLKDDIMTPLCSLLKQYYADWQPKFDEKEKGKAIDEKEAFIQAVILLWTLCEHNEYAVKCSNEEDLVSILTKFFDITTYGIEIVTIVIQCLLSLSEDNSVAIKKLKIYEDTLIQLLNLEVNDVSTSETVCLKTAISGLLINMTNYIEDNPSIVCKVINVLSDVLSIDCEPLLSSLTLILPHEKNTFLSNTRKKVQENRRIFSAQQQALEILANLCSEDQEDENNSVTDDSDYEADDGVDDICMDDKLYKTICSIPLEIVEAFNSCNIIKKVWNKTRAVDKDTVEILQQNVEGVAVLKQMQELNCRAYLCLNNLITSLEIDALGGIETLYRMWMDIGSVIFKDTSFYSIELLESATSTMRAAIQKLSEEKANIFNRLTLSDIAPILSEGRKCPNTNVRVNLIRILGNLALILMNNDTPEAQEIIKHISLFLLETCRLESEVWVIAESLDAIMDIYAEDDSDQLANEFKLLEKLRGVVPHFKNKVRQERKTLGDNVAVVSTVNTNITRFIKYKEKQMKNL